MENSNQELRILKGTGIIHRRFVDRLKFFKSNSHPQDSRIILIDSPIDLSFLRLDCAYLFNSDNLNPVVVEFLNRNNISYLFNIKNFSLFRDDDIVELSKFSQIIRIIIKNESTENVIALTNQCNSNCIFCPDSEQQRKKPQYRNIEELERIISLINPNIPFLTITGGEPTLHRDFNKIVESCRDHLPNTELTILTNGRMFAYWDFTKEFAESVNKRCKVSIPIHASTSCDHNSISQVPGSLEQTMAGILNLINLGIHTQVRIVVNKQNYKHLLEISKMIFRELPGVSEVIFMTLEMLGNALKNKEMVWINYDQVRKDLHESVVFLLAHYIKVLLYNFPLCYLDEDFWGLSQKSISTYKRMFPEECNSCRFVADCGGFFHSTFITQKVEVRPYL